MPMNKRVKSPNYLLYFVPEIIGSFKHATFLRHGRQPEVNILQARIGLELRSTAPAHAQTKYVGGSASGLRSEGRSV